jgi:hypothetical protein
MWTRQLAHCSERWRGSLNELAAALDSLQARAMPRRTTPGLLGLGLILQALAFACGGKAESEASEPLYGAPTAPPPYPSTTPRRRRPAPPVSVPQSPAPGRTPQTEPAVPEPAAPAVLPPGPAPAAVDAGVDAGVDVGTEPPVGGFDAGLEPPVGTGVYAGAEPPVVGAPDAGADPAE